MTEQTIEPDPRENRAQQHHDDEGLSSVHDKWRDEHVAGDGLSEALRHRAKVPNSSSPGARSTRWAAKAISPATTQADGCSLAMSADAVRRNVSALPCCSAARTVARNQG